MVVVGDDVGVAVRVGDSDGVELEVGTEVGEGVKVGGNVALGVGVGEARPTTYMTTTSGTSATVMRPSPLASAPAGSAVALPPSNIFSTRSWRSALVTRPSPSTSPAMGVAAARVATKPSRPSVSTSARAQGRLKYLLKRLSTVSRQIQEPATVRQ